MLLVGTGTLPVGFYSNVAPLFGLVASGWLGDGQEDPGGGPRQPPQQLGRGVPQMARIRTSGRIYFIFLSKTLIQAQFFANLDSDPILSQLKNLRQKLYR